MARGTGRGGKAGGRGTPDRDYYNRLPSDAEYKKTSHQRAAQRARKTWLIRLLVIGALVVAVRLWGADVMRLARVQAHQTGSEVGEVSNNITEGRDRRAGVGFDEWEDKAKKTGE